MIDVWHDQHGTELRVGDRVQYGDGVEDHDNGTVISWTEWSESVRAPIPRSSGDTVPVRWDAPSGDGNYCLSAGCNNLTWTGGTEVKEEDQPDYNRLLGMRIPYYGYRE